MVSPKSFVEQNGNSKWLEKRVAASDESNKESDPASTARKRQAVSPITQQTREFVLFQMCREVDAIQEGSVAGDSFRARKTVLEKYKNNPDSIENNRTSLQCDTYSTCTASDVISLNSVCSLNTNNEKLDY